MQDGNDQDPGDGVDTPIRKIIHVDMDAFYASVEQRDDPALRGQPVAVGGSSRRGVVAAASYEARKFGVRSAMPSITAKRQCPALIFVPPRFEVYRDVSHQIRAIFRDYADEVEPLSLDEAYLDVSADKAGLGSATATARLIRRRIREETGLTASAGVSYNKFIAKLASDQNKPDGLTVIPPGRGAAFVQTLSIRRFHGIGPVTAAKMEGLGIFSGADLAAKDPLWLATHFGNSAEWLFNLARGIDHRRVKSNRPLKSLGGERTFFNDLITDTEIREALAHVCTVVWDRAAKKGARGRTVTLKLRYADFQTITRAKSVSQPIIDGAGLLAAGEAILAPLLPTEQGIRLLGITLSKFEGEENEEEGGAAAPADLLSLI
ncbi:DNA polymerase IV [Sphingopyxis sp. RIFCSPHIGHO2_12_FULL_65_19]|uniref:DNA polymerase IV n=1 Tax=Sphingopyxis sp. RIFCSPHIGHO2_12_FULL_65_19 TaxID=1802172 RepID=UPI0008B3A519|nr:DNA polymerase IV [Sphingopyxis sp. RIFCSPHIGHO2_12_FULL_65_19]OHD04956.1 MAG: DNA polymerase IV [Sphingopyxis sp. RIFCSPHIGHO2_12_FULL_65_19]